MQTFTRMMRITQNSRGWWAYSPQLHADDEHNAGRMRTGCGLYAGSTLLWAIMHTAACGALLVNLVAPSRTLHVDILPQGHRRASHLCSTQHVDHNPMSGLLNHSPLIACWLLTWQVHQACSVLYAHHPPCWHLCCMARHLRYALWQQCQDLHW
jgi:hypothetical protein